MSSEKIAFIFPTAKDAEGREGPILNFQCAALPVEMKLAIAAAFVGLQQSKNYLISIDVTDRNGTTVLNGQAKEIPVKIPVTANDPEAEPTDVPGFLSISVLTRVANTGVHIIRCSIAHADTPDETIHETEARFRVNLTGGVQ
ncbi:hypothetical protein [Photorhabdus bodei]|uniref:Uncharacterized protein n=1 Tax=Photorhabdus bodei TaxID=2029681 RepID=A0A329X870_9GAMM|nr:hypothetical protein [Photorhabdus bodei]RAX12170.1 hypothetical protein CKY02_12060 [Photorhabdus bodei]